jgi:hypothetical protein
MGGGLATRRGSWRSLSTRSTTSLQGLRVLHPVARPDDHAGWSCVSSRAPRRPVCFVSQPSLGPPRVSTWPAGSWSPARWGRHRACGWPAPSRTCSTASVGRWQRCASPPDWWPCCSQSPRDPGLELERSAPGEPHRRVEPAGSLPMGSGHPTSARPRIHGSPGLALRRLLPGESDCGTLVLTIAIGGDADAESSLAAPQTDPIGSEGKGVSRTARRLGASAGG